MSKRERILKTVGSVSDAIVDKWHIEECRGKVIVQSMDLYIHIAKHASQYISIDSVNYTIEHIEDIIKTPDYVFYNIENKSIEYYKMLIENVSVVVQNTKKREMYVASVYPVKYGKIENRKKKEKETIDKILLDKYTYKVKS